MLTKEQLDNIKKLQETCEKDSRFKLKLNWDMLSSRKAGVKDDFFYYEGGKLTGFLGLYGFGNKIELCGMVDPKHRRKGIFTRLLDEAIGEAKKRGTKNILLNAPAASESAKKFLASVPNRYRMTEYQMKWEGGMLPSVEGVRLRRSSEKDIPLEILLEVECFGFTEQEAAEFNKEIRSFGTEDFHIIEAEGISVGKMRVDHSEGEAWIFGFAILPEHQGKGIGRKALSVLISKEQAEGRSVFLEVEAKNEQALKLYQSVGFKSYHAQDYYELIF